MPVPAQRGPHGHTRHHHRHRQGARAKVATKVGAWLAAASLQAGGAGLPASAQDAQTQAGPDCQPRAFQYVRSEEDYSAWRLRRCDRDPLDRLRYLELGSAGVVSVGGEVRLRYEIDDSDTFVGTQGDGDGAFFGRAYLFADWHASDWLRTFVNLRATEAWDRESGSRTVDDAGLDLQEAFVELGPTRDLALRLGRQEFSLPTRPPSRLLSARNGLNVRRTFDGAHVLFEPEGARGDAFYLETVDPERGAFNDEASGTERIWGASAEFSPTDSLSWRAYYYGFADEEAEFQAAFGDETRHTLGARAARAAAPGRVDFDAEAAWQWGDLEPGEAAGAERDIRAGFVALDAGYTTELPLSPRFGFQAYWSSGDDADGEDLGTFNALYPSGAYLNDASLLRGQNLASLGLRSDLALPWDIGLSVFHNEYWRVSRDDGVYAVSGALSRAAVPGASRRVGSYTGLRSSIPLSLRIDAAVQAGVFDTGAFLRETGPSDDHIFVRLDLRFRL